MNSPDVSWNRVWPRRSGDPSAGLVLEGRLGDRVVAATAEGFDAPVRLRAQDPRLPELAGHPGRVVGHRWGKRAVLAHEGGFVKLAPARATRTARERHASLTRALQGVPQAPDLVEIAGASATALELRAASGVDLTSVLAAGPAERCRQAGARTGRAVAAVASAHAPDLPVHDTEAEAVVLRRWVADAEAFGVLPAGLGRRAEEALSALVPATAAPVPSHRDLHDGQVLLGERVTFLDVDTAALAEPALDPANLLAHLDLAAARGRRESAAAVEAGLWSAWGHLDRQRVRVLRQVARCRLVAVHSFRGLPADVAAELLHG